MLGFLRPVWRIAALAGLFLSLWIGVEILAVRQTAVAVDRIKLVEVVSGAGPAGFLQWLREGLQHETGVVRAVLALAALSLMLAVLTYLREVAYMRFSMTQVFLIREALYDKLQRIGLTFHDQISTGEVINRALSDLQKVRVFLQSAVLVTLDAALIAGGYVTLLLFRCPWAAPLALAPLPLWIWYTMRFARRVRPIQVAETEVSDRNVSIITENIAGVHVVKSFATQDQEISKYNLNSDEYLGRVRQRIRNYANYLPVIRSISTTAHLSLFLLAGVLIARGKMQPGDVLILGSAMGALLGRLQQAALINEQYQNAMVSSRRLHEVLSRAPHVAERSGAHHLPRGDGAVRFDHVTFGYDPDNPVLHDVSLEVPAGSTVALVGPTGAGKTTLIQLLGRLYDPQLGRIEIDGMDVRDARLDDLRSEIAYVFQETYLFSDTVEANVAYGKPERDGEHVSAAMRVAQAGEFVDALPRGRQTLLGERGATLSGGQRQRLAIARALLTDPRILILDDATAAIDPDTEALIHAGIREDRRGRTVFVIAHRLNTVRYADLVVVLNVGRIAQVGVHDELMETDGYYRSIARLQLRDADCFDDEDELPAHTKRVATSGEVETARAAADAARPRPEGEE